MNTVIVYYSKHHENTKKVLDAIKEVDPSVTLVDVLKEPEFDLSNFDRVGFASGIYFSKFAKQITSYMQAHLVDGKEVFFVYTHGAPLVCGVTRKVKKIAKQKNCKVIGSLHTRGYDTYVMKRFGGIAKKHPSNKDLKRIQKQYQTMQNIFMNKKHLFLFLPLLCLSACSNSPNFDYSVKPVDPDEHYDNVYIIMGQSNASGIAQASWLETKDPVTYAKYAANYNKVEISYDVDQRVSTNFVPVRIGFGAAEGFYGPEIGISEVISEVDEKSYIIKATWSGSCLQSQYVNKNGDTFELYDRFVPFIKDQLKRLERNNKNPRVKGLFWMQGESDSLEGLCDTYGEALEWFVRRMRMELNDYVYGYMNFVDAYISTKTIWPSPDPVNQGKEEFAKKDEHNYCIKTNGEDSTALDLGIKSQTGEDINDPAHYDSLSMLALGKEAGKYLIK